MLIIHTTTSSKKEAKHLIRLLLESRLIACAQYCKIKSHYIWEGKIQKEREYLLILKSEMAYYNAIESLILANHSYEIPQIITYEASASTAYEQWLLNELKAQTHSTHP